MPTITTEHNTASNIEKNISFFSENEEYQKNVNSMDTYNYMRLSIENELDGVKSLLDIGNGGFFNYDITNVPRVVALDLFLDEKKNYGRNVTAIQGDALNFTIPYGVKIEKFDAIIVQMLIHHLPGASPEQAVRNIDLLFEHCRKHLSEKGKLIIIESTVPSWFYGFEKTAFRVLNPIWSFPHPLVIQHTPEELLAAAKRNDLSIKEYTWIPKGKWVLQFGLPFPAALTPIQPIKLVLTK